MKIQTVEVRFWDNGISVAVWRTPKSERRNSLPDARYRHVRQETISILTSALGKLGWSSHINTQNWTVSYDAPTPPPAHPDNMALARIIRGALTEKGAELGNMADHIIAGVLDEFQPPAPQQQADGRALEIVRALARSIEYIDNTPVGFNNSGVFSCAKDARALLKELDGPE